MSRVQCQNIFVATPILHLKNGDFLAFKVVHLMILSKNSKSKLH